MAVSWSLILFSLLLNVSNSKDECISHAAPEDLDTVLGTFNNLSCYDIQERQTTLAVLADLKIITLTVKSSCIKTTEVELKVLLAGQKTCSDQPFLFVLKDVPQCRSIDRCEGWELPYETFFDATLCLVKCPVKQNERNDYEIQLIHKMDYSSWQICGLGVFNGPHTWLAPEDWPVGDQPAIYRGFESETDLILNGASLRLDTLHNFAVSAEAVSRQWVSLGNLSEHTCLPGPESCGEEGGTLSVWMRISDCSVPGSAQGFITSLLRDSPGFFCRCKQGKMRCGVRGFREGQGQFAGEGMEFPFNSWFHLVLIYHGPEVGITVYINDRFWTFTTRESISYSDDAPGLVIIGKLYVERNTDYSNVMADELTFWNRKLSDLEAEALRTKYLP